MIQLETGAMISFRKKTAVNKKRTKMQISRSCTMQMACRAKTDGLPAEFKASTDPQKSEYQFEKNFSNILYLQLCLKRFPPFQ